MNKDIYHGIRCALPITLGYIPIGLAFGVLAVQQGLNLFEIGMMSLIVYAGSSQFIASAMIASGAAAAAIVAATLLVNLRHLLMSASLSPYFKGLSMGVQSILALGITDETFAVGIAQARSKMASPHFYLGLHATAHISWLLSTLLGGLAGSAIPDPARWGLNFALGAMFIGLLIMQLHNQREILVAVAAGVLSLIIALILPGNYHIIIASVTAAALGVLIESWKQKSCSSLSE